MEHQCHADRGISGKSERVRDGCVHELEHTDARAGNSRFTPEALQANQAIIDGVRAVADRLGASVAQVSLAWVLAQGPNVIPIPGPDRIDQLEENLGAAKVVLDDEEEDSDAAVPSDDGGDASEEDPEASDVDE